MDEDTRRILFDEPQILAVAIGVALVVVALLAILYSRIYRRLAVGFGTGAAAAPFAFAVVIWGDLAFTRWALYDGGHGRSPGMAPFSQWLVFVGVNAVLAVGAAVPAAIMGAIVGHIATGHDSHNSGAAGQKV